VPAGRAVAAGELRALVEACGRDAGLAGPRDAALIALLYVGGLRRAELAALHLADYDPEAADWLALRGPRAGALFVRVNKHDQLWGDGLSAQAVYAILRKRAAQAGLSKPVSPHDLRRTFVGDLLDAGADIATVQRLAGHANVTTTSRYDRRGERAKRQAVDKLHFPYRDRGDLPLNP